MSGTLESRRVSGRRPWSLYGLMALRGREGAIIGKFERRTCDIREWT